MDKNKWIEEVKRYAQLVATHHPLKYSDNENAKALLLLVESLITAKKFKEHKCVYLHSILSGITEFGREFLVSTASWKNAKDESAINGSSCVHATGRFFNLDGDSRAGKTATLAVPQNALVVLDQSLQYREDLHNKCPEVYNLSSSQWKSNKPGDEARKMIFGDHVMKERSFVAFAAEGMTAIHDLQKNSGPFRDAFLLSFETDRDIRNGSFNSTLLIEGTCEIYLSYVNFIRQNIKRSDLPRSTRVQEGQLTRQIFITVPNLQDDSSAEEDGSIASYCGPERHENQNIFASPSQLAFAVSHGCELDDEDEDEDEDMNDEDEENVLNRIPSKAALWATTCIKPDQAYPGCMHVLLIYLVAFFVKVEVASIVERYKKDYSSNFSGCFIGDCSFKEIIRVAKNAQTAQDILELWGRVRNEESNSVKLALDNLMPETVMDRSVAGYSISIMILNITIAIIKKSPKLRALGVLIHEFVKFPAFDDKGHQSLAFPQDVVKEVEAIVHRAYSELKTANDPNIPKIIYFSFDAHLSNEKRKFALLIPENLKDVVACLVAHEYFCTFCKFAPFQAEASASSKRNSLLFTGSAALLQPPKPAEEAVDDALKKLYAVAGKYQLPHHLILNFCTLVVKNGMEEDNGEVIPKKFSHLYVKNESGKVTTFNGKNFASAMREVLAALNSVCSSAVSNCGSTVSDQALAQAAKTPLIIISGTHKKIPCKLIVQVPNPLASYVDQTNLLEEAQLVSLEREARARALLHKLAPSSDSQSLTELYKRAMNRTIHYEGILYPIVLADEVSASGSMTAAQVDVDPTAGRSAAYVAADADLHQSDPELTRDDVCSALVTVLRNDLTLKQKFLRQSLKYKEVKDALMNELCLLDSEGQISTLKNIFLEVLKAERSVIEKELVDSDSDEEPSVAHNLDACANTEEKEEEAEEEDNDAISTAVFRNLSFSRFSQSSDQTSLSSLELSVLHKFFEVFRKDFNFYKLIVLQRLNTAPSILPYLYDTSSEEFASDQVETAITMLLPRFTRTDIQTDEEDQEVSSTQELNQVEKATPADAPSLVIDQQQEFEGRAENHAHVTNDISSSHAALASITRTSPSISLKRKNANQLETTKKKAQNLNTNQEADEDEDSSSINPGHRYRLRSHGTKKRKAT